MLAAFSIPAFFHFDMNVILQELIFPHSQDHVGILRDVDGVAQVTNAAFNLDFVMEKLFKGGQIKDLVTDRLGAVDGVLEGGDVSNQMDWRSWFKQAIS